MTYQELYETLGQMCENERRNHDVTVLCSESEEVFKVDQQKSR